MDVDPSYKYIEKIAGGISWYMMESKDFISSISFHSKNESSQIVSFNGKNVTFRLSIGEVQFIHNKCQEHYWNRNYFVTK